METQLDPVRVLEPGASTGILEKSTAHAASGIGTGGGTTKVDTTHVLKDAAQGGALPDTQEALEQAVQAKHLDNEQAMEGSLVLVEGMPELSAGGQVLLRGLGPVFSGLWTICRHVLSVGKEGVQSTLEVTRNALGETATETPSTQEEKTPLPVLSGDALAGGKS